MSTARAQDAVAYLNDALAVNADDSPAAGALQLCEVQLANLFTGPPAPPARR